MVDVYAVIGCLGRRRSGKTLPSRHFTFASVVVLFSPCFILAVILAQAHAVPEVTVRVGDVPGTPLRTKDRAPTLEAIQSVRSADQGTVQANSPPTVTGPTGVDYAENGEGSVATYTATDPEDEAITWSSSGLDHALFSITAGVLEFLTPPNYENPGDQGGDNVYEVEVVATDSSGASGMIAIDITVVDVNDPNIVLIVADDVGYEAFGTYGSTQYNTPEIDKIAAAGIRFTNAFSNPRCTPSRVALMTGKSNVRNYADFRVLLPGEYTIADLFREAGYATAIAGKWQLHGGPTTVDGAAAGTGFDTYCLWNTTKTSDRRYWQPSIECDGEIISSGSDDYGPDIFTNFLLAFIETNRERPFIAYYPMVLPHAPFEQPPRAQCPGADDEQCNFKDMVAYLDYNVGRIRDKLAELELLENTILVFTSDNGTDYRLVSELGGETIHGEKGTTLDDGSHVPLIVHVPGGAGGRVLDDLIDFTDFLPTLADAADLTIPHREDLDGVTFWDRLEGNPGEPRDWIYTYYFPRPYTAGSFNPFAYPETTYARDKRYKLYGTGDLFDVTVDRHELYPLASDDTDCSAARTKLQAVLGSIPERGAEIRWGSVVGIVSPNEPRPRWRPVLSTATVNGAELTLTYAGILDQTVLPPADSFTVDVGGFDRMVSTVSVSDGALTLTLALAVTFGQTVTVSYTPGRHALRHANRTKGHKAAALTDEPVRNDTPPAPPEAPRDLNVTAISDGRLKVSWEAPIHDGGLPVQGYKVQWKSGTQDFDLSRQAEVTDLANLSHTIGGLTDGDSYTVRVSAYNTLGDGASAEASAIADATAPTVASVAITSDPGSNQTYAAGEEIEVTVTFDETVEVTGTPQLRLKVGTRNRTACYVSGTGTVALVFAYEVADGDEDAGGVSIEAGRIALNGGTVEDEAENAAELAHEAVAADKGHQVDGMRPAFVSAAVDGASLTLTYGEALDGGSEPSPGDFTVTVGGSGRTVSDVSVSASVVTLTLNPEVEQGDTGIRVSYTPGTNPIRDELGNDAQALSNRSVTNTTGAPNTAPQITTGETLSVGENQALVRRLVASDTDAGDEVTIWAVAGGADQGQFSITSYTGLFAGGGEILR